MYVYSFRYDNEIRNKRDDKSFSQVCRCATVHLVTVAARGMYS